MTLRWSLLLLLYCEITILPSMPSITGVTYKDDFDFEERYRDVNECNPFYWHPLHLPPYCANMFERLVRGRLASKTPVRIVTKKSNKEQEYFRSEIAFESYSPKKSKRRYKKPNDDIYYLSPEYTRYGYPENNIEYSYPMIQMASSEYESYSDEVYTEKIPLAPHEKMLEQLKADIRKGPSSPTVTVMPNLGPVALYNQAISKKSVNMLKKLAQNYVKAIQKQYKEYYAAYKKLHKSNDPQLYVYDSRNGTKQEKHRKKDKNKDKDDTNKVYRRKTKQGGVVTIIETKNAHLLPNISALM